MFRKVILEVDMILLQLIDLGKRRSVVFLMFYVIIKKDESSIGLAETFC